MTDVLDGKRLAVLGAGKIGSLLVRSFLKQGLVTPDRLRVTVQHAERARALARDLPVGVSTDNRAAASEADVVLLCVKPQSVTGALETIRAELGPGKLLISVAAAVLTDEQLAGPLGGFHYRLDQRHPQLPLFQLEDAVDGAPGRRRDGSLE